MIEPHVPPQFEERIASYSNSVERPAGGRAGLGLRDRYSECRQQAEIKTAFATLAQRRVGALIVAHRGQGVCDLLRSALGDPRDMRKNISFAIAATMLGLAMIFWAGSSVVSAEIVRSKVGLSSQVVTPSSYLPIQVVEPI
jgi:hypothetical protein